MTFGEFAQGRLPALLRFAKVLCIDRGIAEDVVQDVLLKAQRNWSKIEHLDKPEAYVRKMIVNEYLSWRRKWVRVVPLASVPESGPASDVAQESADRDALVSELARLPRRQRAVVVLRYYGGLTDREIADELGCSPGTVRSHLSRALARLRIALDEPSASARKRGADHAD